MRSRRFHILDRILGDDATIVFDFDLEPIVGQDSLPELENFREAVGLQPVIRVSTDMSLQQDRFALARHSTAINEALRHVPDFSDVGMRRDEIAIRENKPRKGAWMLFERGPEIREFHAASIFLFRNIVNPKTEALLSLF